MNHAEQAERGASVLLGAVLRALRESFEIDANAEITLEGVAAQMLAPEYLERCLGLGFTRVSFGVETLDRRLNFLDPWGNRIEVVPYDDVQFTKAPHVLKGMGLGGLEKTPNAIDELKKKGMAPEG